MNQIKKKVKSSIKTRRTICDNYSVEIDNNKIKSWKIKNNLQELYKKKTYSDC